MNFKNIIEKIKIAIKEYPVISVTAILVVLTMLLTNINKISMLLISIPGLLIALSVHEMAHALVAYKMGDKTTKDRITLNPLKHIDPMGALMLLVFNIGWGKPVEINPNNLSKSKLKLDQKEALIAAAGPISNIILAIVLMITIKLVLMFNLLLLIPVNFREVIFLMLYGTVIINLGLAVFNLIPLPPFDGYSIFKIYLTSGIREKIESSQTVIMIAIFVFIYLTDGILIQKIVQGLYKMLGLIIY